MLDEGCDSLVPLVPLIRQPEERGQAGVLALFLRRELSGKRVREDVLHGIAQGTGLGTPPGHEPCRI